jgi:hypothetical protein
LIRVFHKEVDNYDLNGPLEIFNITGIKDGSFDRETFGKQFNLTFDFNNLADLKQNSFDFVTVAIRAASFRLVSFSDDQTFNCRIWDYTRTYYFTDRHLVTWENKASFQKCRHYKGPNIPNELTTVEFLQSHDGYLATHETVAYKDHDYRENVEYTMICMNMLSCLVNLIMGHILFKTGKNILDYQSLKDQRMYTLKFIAQHSRAFQPLDQRGNGHQDLFNKKREILEEAYKQEDKEQKTSAFKLLTFFNITFVIATLAMLSANIINFLDEIKVVEITDNAIKLRDIFLSFGVGLSWINLLEVISVHPQLAMITQTFKLSIRSIGLFLLSILPIFLAYTFSGYCIFSFNERFVDLPGSLINLIALVAGDEVQMNLQLFNEIGIFGVLYGFSFCLFF